MSLIGFFRISIRGAGTLLFAVFVLSSCQNKSDQHENHRVVSERSNDTLTQQVSEGGSEDRTIWQKPYEVIDLLGPIEDKIVADIGAGSGYFSFKLLRKAARVIAIDIEPGLIDLMNEEKSSYKTEMQIRFEARLAKPNDPMLRPKEVDIVFFSNTYSYLQNRVSYLKNLRNKFQSGGKEMIVDFKKKITSIGPDLDQRLAQGEVEKELLDAGYQILLSDDTTLRYQYIIIASIEGNK